MPVALHVGDAQVGHEGQILHDRDGADRGQVLATEEKLLFRMLPLELLDQAGMRDALENAFAVLVARTAIAQVKRALEILRVAVRFVDDHARMSRPRLQAAARVVVQRLGTENWLLDEDQMLKKLRQVLILRHHGEKRLEIAEVFILFISIKGEGVISGRTGADHFFRRAIGVLMMEDEGGQDAKLLAVPEDKILPIYAHLQKPDDLHPLQLNQIQHFFEHYKDLEKGKWVKVKGWSGVADAHKEILEGIEGYAKSQK